MTSLQQRAELQRKWAIANDVRGQWMAGILRICIGVRCSPFYQ